MYFRSDKQNKKKENIVHDIYHYRRIMGEELCSNLLFIHAFSGCDTTSQFCGIGKGTAFDLFVRNVNVQKLAVEFSKTGNTQERIEESGEMAAHILYNANEVESINALRMRLLFTKVAKATSFVKPERLPPTKSALKFHSFRVFLQVLKWIGDDSLKPEEWGWLNIENKLRPKTTNKNPAPGLLLKIIGCNCSSDCSTLHCGCRRGGYPCSSVCGKCQFKECSNIDIPDPECEYAVNLDVDFNII